VAPVLQARTGPSIVYVTTQRQCDEVADALKKKGIESKTYHAGMKSEERKVIQEFFMTSAKGIVSISFLYLRGKIAKGNTV
jgi:superfamily II DNA helicase RecQ